LADQLNEVVGKLKDAHGENLKAVVLYGSGTASVRGDEDRPKNLLVVLNRIAPDDLQSAHPVAEWLRSHGDPVPIYFTSREIDDSSDVFPMEFIDMSRARRVLFGPDPFERLEIPTYNLRHQLEYELRGKLLRLRTVYISVAANPDRLARLMSDSLESFAVLFRHALGLLGADAPYDKRECVLKLAEVLNLDRAVFIRIFEYAADEDVWLEAETRLTFAGYLIEIERVIQAVDELPGER
jgi:hypothetical protein